MRPRKRKQDVVVGFVAADDGDVDFVAGSGDRVVLAEGFDPVGFVSDIMLGCNVCGSPSLRASIGSGGLTPCTY
jgi:hypothetical protein